MQIGVSTMSNMHGFFRHCVCDGIQLNSSIFRIYSILHDLYSVQLQTAKIISLVKKILEIDKVKCLKT